MGERVGLPKSAVEDGPVSGIQAMTLDLLWNYRKIGVEKAQSKGLKGGPLRIGIVDTGIGDHFNIPKSRRFSYSFLETNDRNDHGSHVASIVKRGLPNAELWIAKELDDDGFAADDEFIGISRACHWLLDNEVNIIVMSINGVKDPGNGLMEAVFERAVKNRCVMVISGGNSPSDEPLYPAADSRVISVGMTDKEFNVHRSSAKSVDFVNPGVKIIGDSHDGKAIRRTGTSQAGPHIAINVGYIIEEYFMRHNSWPEVKYVFDVLKKKALDILQRGRDDDSGYGFVQYEKQTDYIYEGEGADDIITVAKHIPAIWYVLLVLFLLFIVSVFIL